MAFNQLSSKLVKLTDILQRAFSSKPGKNKNQARKSRSLHIDVLEERALLSVSVGSAYDLMVNQPNPSTVLPNWRYATTTVISGTNQSTASNDAGDFVATWTQEEPVWLRDENGVPLLDDNGDYRPYLVYNASTKRQEVAMESNIYARYFTDEIQRITLPDELLTTSGGNMSRFKLQYGGNEIQKLTFYSATETHYTSADNGSFYSDSDPIYGSFWIGGIYPEGEDYPDVLIHFDETNGAAMSAKLLQKELAGLGPYMQGVKVTAVSSREFNIEFTDNYWKDKDVPELEIRDAALDGFMAGALITTVNQPIEISYFGSDSTSVGIPLYPNNPQKTAEAIEYAFSQYSQESFYAPVNTNVFLGDENEQSTSTPTLGTFQIPKVRVTCIDNLNFEIRFIDESGKMDQPEVLVSSAKDVYGREYVDHDSIFTYGYYKYTGEKYASLHPTTTIKEPSPAFRVNPPEPEDPITPYSDATNQRAPVVAMDADGDFIIAWESDINKWANPFDKTDIFVQRFTVQAVLPEDQITFRPDGKIVQSVRPVGNTIQVNKYENGQQIDPSISCDRYGNFCVSWTNLAQDFSYYIGTKARWFDRDGNPTTLDIDVSPEQTLHTFDSRVFMSEDGATIITWNRSDTQFTLFKSVYLPGSTTPMINNAVISTNAYEPHIAFDSNNRYVLTYTTPFAYPPDIEYTSPELVNPGRDVYATMFAPTIDSDGNVTGETVIRELYRVNSYINPLASETWFSSQVSPTVAIDADGDMIIAYQGYGPDTGSQIYDGGQFMYAYLPQFVNSTKNADLLPYFEYTYYALQNPSGIDVDALIRDFIVYVSKDRGGYEKNPLTQEDEYVEYFKAATQEQIGRMHAILESYFGLMRGGAADIMYTRLDADPILSQDYLVSDSVANAQRDGNNTRLLMCIPNKAISSGAVNVNIYREDAYSSRQENVALSLTVDGDTNQIDIAATIKSLTDTLNSTWIVTQHFYQAHPDKPLDAVRVRNVPASEIADRSGTGYELPFGSDEYVVFEITFIDGAHDAAITFGYYGSDPKEAGQITFLDQEAVNSRGVIRFFGELHGYSGTQRLNSHAVMSKAGSYTITYAQSTESIYTKDQFDNRSLWFSKFTTGPLVSGYYGAAQVNYFYRNFVESTDTAGPSITDYILPDGKSLENYDQVSYALKDLVVTFDEALRDKYIYPNARDQAHNVDNLNNWILLKDGIEVKNGIESIEFRMSASLELAQNAALDVVNTGSLTMGTNKWEAVITFNGDSVDGALSDGQYTLVAKNTIWDIAGNHLGKNGLADYYYPEGQDVAIVFNISVMDGYLGFNPDPVDDSNIASTEHHVNEGDEYSEGNQYFRNDDPKDYPITKNMDSGPKSVASDAEGNFVVVWCSDDPTNPGIFGRKYRAYTTYTTTGPTGQSGETYVEDTIAIFRISANPTASQAAVAMDADGDFVVTWSEEDSSGNRDVYYNYFREKNETIEARYTGSPVRVNTETRYTQQNPAVAIDVEGDFVIVWESEEQDGDGWGIYGQRFAPDGSRVGGKNTVQDVILSGSPSTGGTFSLLYREYDLNGKVIADKTRTIGPITILQNTFEMVAAVQKAFDDQGLEVVVKAAEIGRLQVEFVGSYGLQTVAQLGVVDVHLVNPKSGQTVRTAISTNGTSGEFQVNTTTENDQRYPSIAMKMDGAFVVTWTGWSRATASSYALSADIYARNFVSNHTIRTSQVQNNPEYAYYTDVPTNPGGTSPSPNVVTTDNPANHVVPPGGIYDGVVMISANGAEESWMGSGSLLVSGFHILTAAHVVTNADGTALDPTDLIVTFETASGIKHYQVAEVLVHPSYQGTASFSATVDLAVLQLVEFAPDSVTRYDLYRDQDELGKEITFVGYGATGTGTTGDIEPAGVKRIGWNKYEISGSQYSPMFSPDLLMYDFDGSYVYTWTDSSGNEYRETYYFDAFGTLYGITDAGLGSARESSSAHGDSGGPVFIDGKIAGVVSGGEYPGLSVPFPYPPAGSDPNTVFGTVSWDVRVSSFVDWIEAAISGGGREIRVNEDLYVPIDPEKPEGETRLVPNGDQMWSDVAMDAQGNFVVTWTSFNPVTTASQFIPPAAIYARRFRSDPVATAITGQFLVSNVSATTMEDYHQAHSKISMTPKGDFVIVWEGYGNPMYSDSYEVTFDVLAKRYINTTDAIAYLANDIYDIPGYGNINPANGGALGSEFFVNKTIVGDQLAPSVAVSSTGDIVVVWQGYGETRITKEDPVKEVVDDSGIYYRRIVVTKDISAPYVADAIAAVKDEETGDYKLTQVLDGMTLAKGPNNMILTLSEEVFAENAISIRSILNPANWSLSKGGTQQLGAIVAIDFYTPENKSVVYNGRDTAYGGWDEDHPAEWITSWKSGKIQVVVTFDSQLNEPGDQALTPGDYTLTLRQTVTDLSGNRLDGIYSGRSGGDYNIKFTVAGALQGEDGDDPTMPTDTQPTDGTYTDPYGFLGTNNHDTPAIAVRADGAFVLVGVETTGYYYNRIVARRFAADGSPLGAESYVSSNTNTSNIQTNPDIAMDQYGNYVVVWAGPGEKMSVGGIYARVFDAYGKATTLDIQVPELVGFYQASPKVAINTDGSFVVTWIGASSKGNSLTIYSRAFGFDGKPLSKQIVLATTNQLNDFGVDIASDRYGNYAITWNAYDDATRTHDIFAKTFHVDMYGNYTVARDTFKVNTIVNGEQINPKITMSSEGDFVVAWEGRYEKAPDSSRGGVYARAFTFTGASVPILGTTSDALINQFTLNEQMSPDVAISQDGKRLSVTWTSYNQEPDNFDEDSGTYPQDYGVITRYFSREGTGTTGFGKSTTYVINEFVVNKVTPGNQNAPVIGMDLNGDYTIAWVGYPVSDSTTPQVYVRSYRPNGFTAGNTNSSYFTSSTTNSSSFASTSSKGSTTTAASIFSSANYMRPSGGGFLDFAGGGVSSTYLVSGTAGDDVFEVIPGATAGSWVVKLNGKTVDLPQGITYLIFDGMSGKNTVKITGTAAAETATLDAESRILRFESANLAIKANDVTDLLLDGAGGEDTLTVTTSKGDDILNLDVGSMILSGTLFRYTANNFELVKVVSGGGNDAAVMRDSKEEDHLAMYSNRVLLSGNGFWHEVSGFSSVNAISTSGNDTAVFYGSSQADTLFADENGVTLSGANYWNRAKAFQDMTVQGVGNGNAAQIVGSSKGGDFYTGTNMGSTMNYAGGQTLRFNGFQRIDVQAGRGTSTALLSGDNMFVGYDDHCLWTGGGIEQTLSGFSSMTVQAARGTGSQALLDISAQANATIQASGNGVSLNVDGGDLYHLIAFDQVRARKASGGTVGKLQSVTDYLFCNGAWE